MTNFKNFSSIFAFLILFSTQGLLSQNVYDRARGLRLDITGYLREIKPMALNFRCTPYPACTGTEASKNDNNKKKQESLNNTNSTTSKDTELSSENYEVLYDEINKMFLEANTLYFEDKMNEAYALYSKLQLRIESFLEKISVFYLERTDEMIKSSVFKKQPADSEDKILYDAFVDYGPSSHKRDIIEKAREVPQVARAYNSKERHWILNKYAMEGNIQRAYMQLGQAKKTRLNALRIVPEIRPQFREMEVEESNVDDVSDDSQTLGEEKNLKVGGGKKEGRGQAKELASRRVKLKADDIKDLNNPRYFRKLDLRDHKKRLETFLDSVRLCRRAKANAGYVFMLKYPYENYALFNPFGLTEKGVYEPVHNPQIEDVSMIWVENPNIEFKNFNPVYDLRIPDAYRRDLADVRHEVYDEEIDRNIRLKYNRTKPASFQSGLAPNSTIKGEGTSDSTSSRRGGTNKKINVKGKEGNL